jgi:serine/threonine protein kinase
MPSKRIDWEAFYRDYRKPNYIPGFEIINKLGGGMFGLVFKARKASIGKDYAIKFLKVDDETVRDAVGRELDAVRYFAQIDHPNLVSIEDMGEVDGIPYLVMSYAGQDTLRKRLDSGGLGRDEAMRIFLQAARGVHALHERSLVHFDLKPANIFLKGDIARVGDFGLSKLVSESRNSLSFGRGTPYYMAPELLQRRGDARSDIYSLGVVLFECLCGDVPFRGDSEWEVLRKHESKQPDYPTTLGAGDRAVLECCLAKDPVDRFASAAELLHALHAPAAAGESLILPPQAGAAARPHRDGDAAALDRKGRLALGDGDTSRDTSQSPYGLPWRQPNGSSGFLAFAVRQVFRAIESLVFVLLLPVRMLSGAFGEGLAWLLELPFRLLSVLARAVGLVVVVSLVVLAVVVLVKALKIG